MRNIKSRNYFGLIIPIVLFIIVLISGCTAGISKEARLEAFIVEMESGATANPRSHFAGQANAWKIDSDTFNNVNMAPFDNLDITGYVINGDTFTMNYTTDGYGAESILTASFYMEVGTMGGEDWFIKSMTVPFVLSTKVIPDSL